MNIMAFRIGYIVLLAYLGWFFSTHKKYVAMRRSLFDAQTWPIGLGVFSAILIHLVGMGAGLLSPNRPWVWLVYIGMELGLLVVFLILYRIVSKKPYAVLGFSFARLPLQMLIGLRWILGYFLIGNAFFYVISFFLLKVLKLPAILESLILPQRQAMRGGSVLLGFIEREFGVGFLWIPVLFLVLIGPLLEELVFRGFLYSPIRRSFGPTNAIFLTAFLFMLGHGQISPSVLVFGLLFAYLYESTQSLVPSVLFHVLINLRIVQFYFIRHEPLNPALAMSESGWRVIFFATMFMVVAIMQSKLNKKGIVLSLKY